MIRYPFTPRSNAHLEPGQFWSIELSDGRFACGRVLRVDRGPGPGRRTRFVAGLLDWVGPNPPTAESIAGASVLEAGHAHVTTITDRGGVVLGERPLDEDGLAPPSEVGAYWGIDYPALRAEQRFAPAEPPSPRPERRNVASPLTEEMLRPSASGRGVVQFSRALSDGDFRNLAAWLCRYPEISLRVYGSSEITDLEFLRFFPSLRRFSADALYELGSAAGLRHLPEDLEALALGGTRRKLDLEVLARFSKLKMLHLEGQTKHIEVVSELTTVEEMTLRSITLPDLSLLLPLTRLVSLGVKLGGTRDLSLLPNIGRLRYLELWLIRGLSDISMVGGLRDLRFLFLQALRRVTSLPNLSQATRLRRVHLETMKGIRDLRPLTSAPGLREVVLVDMPQLQPTDVAVLAGMPHLAAVTPGLGSLRKNARARALIGLPRVTGAFDWRLD